MPRIHDVPNEEGNGYELVEHLLHLNFHTYMNYATISEDFVTGSQIPVGGLSLGDGNFWITKNFINDFDDLINF